MTRIAQAKEKFPRGTPGRHARMQAEFCLKWSCTVIHYQDRPCQQGCYCQFKTYTEKKTRAKNGCILRYIRNISLPDPDSLPPLQPESSQIQPGVDLESRERHFPYDERYDELVPNVSTFIHPHSDSEFGKEKLRTILGRKINTDRGTVQYLVEWEDPNPRHAHREWVDARWISEEQLEAHVSTRDFDKCKGYKSSRPTAARRRSLRRRRKAKPASPYRRRRKAKRRLEELQ